MLLSKEIINKIQGKFSRPLHITYIARYIIELPVDETRNLLLKLVDMGIIEESKYGEDYYVLKSQR